jgi:hypothetical protein
MNKTVCILGLYDKYGENLEYTNIELYKESNTEYYDLYDKYGNLMCMDGETCKVIEEDDRYKLINTDGEYDTEFYLTKEEFKVATYE